MDENARLILIHALPEARWEDEMPARYDLKVLQEEFHRRLYGKALAPNRKTAQIAQSFS